MKRRFQIGLILFLSLLKYSTNTFAAENQGTHLYQRVISLSPSITELLFELGLEERIIGVTRFCKFPKEARSKESVGGLLDPNFEIIYRLNPDLVIYHEGPTNHEQTLKAMKLNTLQTKSTSIVGILESIREIGNLFGKEKKAGLLTKKIQDKIDFIESKTKNLPKPRVLITYWRPLGEGQITEVHIAGNTTFFNDLISIASGINAYSGPQAIISPLISAEGILTMNPDVIIEIKGTLNKSEFSVDEVLKDWENLSGLAAYKNKKIFILHQEYIGIPGPRITQTMQALAECIHPNLDWH